ncbi:MAG TPA: hypothetical protein P5560_12475 [Thermotogota bacterium]|nr:hypothetical protein [Thermotogota bacterium]
MTYQISRTIARLFSGAVLLVIYLFQVTGRVQQGVLATGDLQSLAQLMLVFLGIGIGVTVVVEIVFHVLFSIGIAVKENIKSGGSSDDKEIEKTIKQEMVEDEMAKLIDLKSLRVGYVVCCIGVVFSLVLLAFGYPVFLSVNLLFVSLFLAGIVEGFSRIFFYLRGI